MLISHQREKLLNAIVYFVKNTNRCFKVKLFKLLYLFDFAHYKQTGRSSTGLNYYAWEKGPVPNALFEEIDNPREDMKKHVQFKIFPGNINTLLIEPLVDFDDSYFSARELKLLESLSKEYRDSNALEMVEKTHLKNSPWHQVFEVQNNEYGEIPYKSVFSDEEYGEMKNSIQEHEEMVRNYS